MYNTSRFRLPSIAHRTFTIVATDKPEMEVQEVDGTLTSSLVIIGIDKPEFGGFEVEAGRLNDSYIFIQPGNASNTTRYRPRTRYYYDQT